MSSGLTDALRRLSDTLAVLYAEGPEQAPGRFHDWAFDVAKPALAFDKGFWGAGSASHDMPAGPTLHNVHLHNLPTSMTAEWEAIKHTAEDLAFVTRVLEAGGDSVTFGGTGLRPHAFYRRHGVAQIVTSYIQHPVTGLFDVVSFYRADHDAPFSEDERLMHQALVPHLLEVERRHQLRHLDPGCRCEATRPSSQAICDRRGVLRLAGSGFVSLVRTGWPSWQGPLLPQAIVERLASPAEGKMVLGQVVIGVQPQRDMFVLTARLRVAADELSPREREVAILWRDGRSYKQVAATMKVSPATVRNHLAKAYEKLSVSNRVQLSKALEGQ